MKEIINAQSESEELNQAHDLILEASSWLKEKGIQQWEVPISKRNFKIAAERGEVFVLIQDDSVIASVTLSRQKDEYWGKTEGTALYLHRFVVSRKFKGQKLGQMMLNWAQEYSKQQGFECLRLDCRENNSVLLAYYTSQGFSFKGIGRGQFDFALFEKKL